LVEKEEERGGRRDQEEDQLDKAQQTYSSLSPLSLLPRRLPPPLPQAANDGPNLLPPPTVLLPKDRKTRRQTPLFLPKSTPRQADPPFLLLAPSSLKISQSNIRKRWPKFELVFSLQGKDETLTLPLRALRPRTKQGSSESTRRLRRRSPRRPSWEGRLRWFRSRLEGVEREGRWGICCVLLGRRGSGEEEEGRGVWRRVG